MKGSVSKDASGRWAFVVDIGTGAQRRQVRRRGFVTKRAAQEALAEVIGDARRGTYVAPARETVGGYLTRWLDALAAEGLRPATIQNYRDVLRLYALPALADVPLQALSALELDRLYGELAGRGLSLRTVRLAHTIVTRALGDAERKGLIVRNPARLASPPKASATRAPEATVWAPEELAAFLGAVAGSEHYPLLRLAAMSGMRRGELVGLRWADVDLDAGTVTIAQQVGTVGQAAVTGPVKTRAGRRAIDLDAETVRVLRERRRVQLEHRMMMGAGWQDRDDRVFTMADGRPWHPKVISRAFVRLVEVHGLPALSIHDLRHTHATHLLTAGVNPKVVSERLGHTSVAFTLDTYGHVMPTQQAEAATAVARLVDGM
jgi:integrase